MRGGEGGGGGVGLFVRDGPSRLSTRHIEGWRPPAPQPRPVVCPYVLGRAAVVANRRDAFEHILLFAPFAQI